MGEELSGEVQEAVGRVAALREETECARRGVRDADRRCGILVCGMFFRLKLGKGRRPSGPSGGGIQRTRRSREKLDALVELRGAARRETTRQAEQQRGPTAPSLSK